MAGAQQIARHGRTHVSGADKCEFHGNVILTYGKARNHYRYPWFWRAPHPHSRQRLYGNPFLRWGDRAVSDYTGTHSFAGVIEPDVKRKLTELVTLVDLHIVTADSFGTAERELAGIAIPYKLRSGRHDIEKADYVSHFHLPHVAAFGNGNNDRLMLK